MREIKFRAKHVADDSVLSGEWVFGDLLHTIDAVKHIHQVETDSYFEIIPETVGQSTGLKDKNGVDIYEGDICEYGFNTVLCEWFKGGFWLNGSQKGANYNIHLGNNIYVIGNIHDNPELLKTE